MDERRLPTIRDFRDRLTKLVDEGLGELPMQIMICPDSTIQAIAKADGHAGAAIMVEFPLEGRDLGVCIITADRLSHGGGMPSIRQQ